jgi:hypothetical protein
MRDPSLRKQMKRDADSIFFTWHFFVAHLPFFFCLVVSYSLLGGLSFCFTTVQVFLSPASRRYLEMAFEAEEEAADNAEKGEAGGGEDAGAEEGKEEEMGEGEVGGEGGGGEGDAEDESSEMLEMLDSENMSVEQEEQEADIHKQAEYWKKASEKALLESVYQEQVFVLFPFSFFHAVWPHQFAEHPWNIYIREIGRWSSGSARPKRRSESLVSREDLFLFLFFSFFSCAWKREREGETDEEFWKRACEGCGQGLELVVISKASSTRSSKPSSKPSNIYLRGKALIKSSFSFSFCLGCIYIHINARRRRSARQLLWRLAGF